MIEALETENSAMDRDPFDQQLMDYLFDELDEVTRASVKRRLDTDAAARELEAKLRGALDLAKLTLEEPSDDLEARILEAAARVAQGEPWHRKLLRSLAWAGSHAMRPQFAMAALLVMVLGSSVLLLRAKPGAMRVTAEGVASPQRAPNGQRERTTRQPTAARKISKTEIRRMQSARSPPQARLAARTLRRPSSTKPAPCVRLRAAKLR